MERKRKYEKPRIEIIEVEIECVLQDLSAWGTKGDPNKIIEGTPDEETIPGTATTPARRMGVWGGTGSRSLWDE